MTFVFSWVGAWIMVPYPNTSNFGIYSTYTYMYYNCTCTCRSPISELTGFKYLSVWRLILSLHISQMAHPAYMCSLSHFLQHEVTDAGLTQRKARVKCPTKERNTKSTARVLAQTNQSWVKHTTHEATASVINLMLGPTQQWMCRCGGDNMKGKHFW